MQKSATPSTHDHGLFQKGFGFGVVGGSNSGNGHRNSHGRSDGKVFTAPAKRPSTSSSTEPRSPKTKREAGHWGATSSSIGRKPSFTFTARSPKAVYPPRTSSAVQLDSFAAEKRRDIVGVTELVRPSTATTSPAKQRALPLWQSRSIAEQGSTARTGQRQDQAQADVFRTLASSTTPYANMLASTPTSSAFSTYKPLSAGTSSNPGLLSPTLETITYQHIQDMASKRISTLGYLRKAHEGHVFWFQTLRFSKTDLARMPYFDNRKLARRATNYLLLGLSLPTILDLSSSNPVEFLKTLNALLAEFDSYQQIHPPDGSTSSLSRARIPQMFKRATGAGGGKGRRASSAADIGLPFGSESYDIKSSSGGMPPPQAAGSATAFPNPDSDLLPGEEYTYLLTPSLPFEPDFYETFATLCDVLIDCYTKITSLIATPRDCGPHVAEAFTKADGKVRKIIIQGVVKEFEDASRSGVKSEIAGISKVVLGGLM